MNQIELRISQRGGNGRLRRFSGPSCWAEVSPVQSVAISRLQAQIKTRPEAVFPVLTLFYGIRRRLLRWLFDEPFLRYHGLDGDELHLTLSQGVALIETLAWTSEPDPEARFILRKFRLGDYQFGTPRTWFRRLVNPMLYTGPTDGLGSLTFGQFMWAESAYRKNDLVRLTAILFGPAGTRFDLDTVDERTKRFGVLDPAVVATVVRQYEDSLRYMARCFPRVFPTADPARKVTRPNGSGWLDVALAMAKLDVTKIGAIENTNVYLALRTLDKQIELMEEMEAARPNY